MLRYVTVALALKMFSLNAFTRRQYRKLGNATGRKARQSIKVDRYIRMGNELVELADKYQVIDPSGGSSALELGTGWMHWYSLYLRLHRKTGITMFDVWDNRQLDSLKMVFSRCEGNQSSEKHSMEPSELKKLIDSSSFEQIYDEFGLKYFISAEGDLSSLPESSFDLIFSYDVLEHIPLEAVERAIEQQYNLLKPGAYAIHNIGIGDHLTQYDRKESWKKYLEYSDNVWKMFFENSVQYVNRLQVSDWLDVFQRKGFVLLEKRLDLVDIDKLKINKKFSHYPKDDLACKALTLVLRKP